MPTETQKTLAPLTPQQHEAFFQEIVLVFNHLDNVLAAVASDKVKNRDIQFNLVVPFITQARNSVDTLAELYTEVARKKRPITPDLQDKVEGAFRSFYEALEEIITNMEEKLLPEGKSS